MLGALVLGVSTSVVWAEQEVGSVSDRSAASNLSGQSEREILVDGRIICVACSLEDVRKQHPQTPSLYQLTSQRGRMVMQIENVDEQRDTLADTLHIRGADEILAQLSDKQSVQKDVTLAGRLGSDH